MNRAVFASLTILFLLSVSSITGFIQVAKADSGTIYIQADGSIDPPTAPIATVDNVTYVLTHDISDPIVVEKNNIVVDGAGHTVAGSGSAPANGTMLTDRSNVTVRNMTIRNFNYGIWLGSSSNNTLSGNNVTANKIGIWLDYSSNNTLSGNSVTANKGVGIVLDSSSNNSVFHNCFVNNTGHVSTAGWNNTWDDGFASGGNYWSNYKGTDSNSDGIGDTPYVIDANNVDHYPLMGHFESFNVSTWSHPNDGFEEVDVISNFTISNLGLYEWLTTPNQYLQAGQLFLRLVPVQRQNMTAGFCRMTLPNNILNASYYTVLIDMTPIIVNKLAISNDTHTTLYFTFNTSAIEGIIIVPEFPSIQATMLFILLTLLTVIIYKKKGVKTSQSQTEPRENAITNHPSKTQKSLICTATEDKLGIKK
jgi:parallel beta-helix repeat protein